MEKQLNFVAFFFHWILDLLADLDEVRSNPTAWTHFLFVWKFSTIEFLPMPDHSICSRVYSCAWLALRQRWLLVEKRSESILSEIHLSSSSKNVERFPFQKSKNPILKSTPSSAFIIANWSPDFIFRWKPISRHFPIVPIIFLQVTAIITRELPSNCQRTCGNLLTRWTHPVHNRSFSLTHPGPVKMHNANTTFFSLFSSTSHPPNRKLRYNITSHWPEFDSPDTGAITGASRDFAVNWQLCSVFVVLSPYLSPTNCVIRMREPV